jgi:hypothetical protein
MTRPSVRVYRTWSPNWPFTSFPSLYFSATSIGTLV